MENHRHTSSKGKERIFVDCLESTHCNCQVIGGWISNRLALLLNASHVFSDVLSLIIGSFAYRLSRKRPTINLHLAKSGSK